MISLNYPIGSINPAVYYEKRRMTQVGNFAGLGIILMMAFSYTYAYFIKLVDWLFPRLFATPFMTHELVRFTVSEFIPYVLMIGMPFIVASWIGRVPIRPFTRRQKVEPATAVLVLLLGLSVFVIANLLTDGVIFVWSGFGLPVPDLSGDQDGSTGSLILSLISTAVLPAVFEEMSFRGILLERLRPFGDRFAVVVSALLFGLAHGNIIQIPFAFVLGLFFGYIVVRTNNILLAMLLHFLNNGISVLFEYVGLVNPDIVSALQVAWFMLMLLMGTVSLLVLYRGPHRFFAPLGTIDSPITPSHRNTIFWAAPCMIIALVLLALRFVSSVITLP